MRSLPIEQGRRVGDHVGHDLRREPAGYQPTVLDHGRLTDRRTGHHRRPRAELFGLDQPGDSLRAAVTTVPCRPAPGRRRQGRRQRRRRRQFRSSPASGLRSPSPPEDGGTRRSRCNPPTPIRPCRPADETMNLAPTGRGAEPDTRTTVATATFLPSADPLVADAQLVFHI